MSVPRMPSAIPRRLWILAVWLAAVLLAVVTVCAACKMIGGM